MDKFSNLLQLANFPMAFGGPSMPFGQQMGMGGFGNMGGGMGGFGGGFMGQPSPMGMRSINGGGSAPSGPPDPIGLRPFPFSGGGYGMNNLTMMNRLGRGDGSGYGGY